MLRERLRKAPGRFLKYGLALWKNIMSGAAFRSAPRGRESTNSSPQGTPHSKRLSDTEKGALPSPFAAAPPSAAAASPSPASLRARAAKVKVTNVQIITNPAEVDVASVTPTVQDPEEP